MARAGFILFTDKGERVPCFTDPFQTTTSQGAVVKHGWREVRTWMPGFFVLRVGKHYRVGRVWRKQHDLISGSVYQLRAWDWQPNQWLLDTRFPNIASVEVYLGTMYGQS